MTYLEASTTKPSDSFPDLLAQVIGGTPRSTGVWYDVSYDRALSPPDACPGTLGTQVVYDEQIDRDLTQLDGGGGSIPPCSPEDGKAQQDEVRIEPRIACSGVRVGNVMESVLYI